MNSETDPQKQSSARRWLTLLLRSAHISATAVIMGGVFLGAGHDEIRVAIWATLSSGSLMLLLDILKSPRVMLQGSGLFILLKLALLAIGFFLLPEHRFYWYLAATVTASIGSHMPGTLRHYDVLDWLKNRNVKGD